MKIKTHFQSPPIPDRRFDWCAWDDDLGEDGSRYGWGSTEKEAVSDLMARLEENSL